MENSTINLEFLAKQVQTLLGEARHLRKDVSEVRQLTLQTFDFARRVERRQAELRDDLEVTIKSSVAVSQPFGLRLKRRSAGWKQKSMNLQSE